MTQRVQNRIKACCADLYAKPAVSWLLGDSFHPGGLALTEHLGRILDLTPADRALDIACGNGTSAMFVAERFGCRVMAVDLAAQLVSPARAGARRRKLDALLDFGVGDAEALPFSAASFDVVFSECAISTLPDKDAAASEMARVLKPGGRLGFTDMVLAREEVAEKLRGWLFQVACIAGARSARKYREIFASVGFSGWQEQFYPAALTVLLAQVRARLLTLEVAKGLQKVDLTGFEFPAAREILEEVEHWIALGEVNYGIFLAVKEAQYV